MPHMPHISHRLLLFFRQLFIICAAVENQQLKLPSIREIDISSWSEVAYLLSIFI